MGVNPWVIEIESKLMSMADTETEMARWRKLSIYRVPANMTVLKKLAYKPQIVSLGPYHHGEHQLMGMEEHKRRALFHFLKRFGKSVLYLIDLLTPVVQDLKDAYDHLDPMWQDDTDAFLKMMILDGCFILEMLWTTNDTFGNDYAPNDPVFSKHGKVYVVSYLKRDLLMLENQIPMLVLEKLFYIQNYDHHSRISENLPRHILKFFFQQEYAFDRWNFGKCLHILDVYRKRLLIENEPLMTSHHGRDNIIRSALELNEAGITIMKSETQSLRDISFKKGILQIPLIIVDEFLESPFLNMIAFERFHVGAGNEITSYVFFMGNIIKNSRDVSLLHACDIIHNAMGTEKAIANLFNSLCRNITLDPESRLAHVNNQVNLYCRQRWQRWRANMVHTYFAKMWTIYSIIAAVILFVLTIVQTLYSVLAYVNSQSS